MISIHAPREGCDRFLDVQRQQEFRISIHAPREGCDLIRLADLRRETDFNPRTP